MDVRKLRETCENLLPLIDKVEFTKPTPIALLKALMEKTISDVDEGHKDYEIMFTSAELINLVKTGTYNEQQVKKFKSDHYAETTHLLSEVNKLRQLQNEPRAYYKLRLADTGEQGGAKNKKHHYLEIESIETEIPHELAEEFVEIQSLSKNDIEYEVVQLPKPYWFAKPFMSIELTKWRLKVYLLIPILLLIPGYYFFMNSLFTPTTEEVIAFFGFLAVIFLLWKPLLPFFETNHKRIAIAPQWMLRFGQLTGQLESVKLAQTRNNGRPYRRIEFVVYEAICPICKNTVEIYDGRKKFKGRLIGECTESPREHVFSFDHTTKKGKLLIE